MLPKFRTAKMGQYYNFFKKKFMGYFIVSKKLGGCNCISPSTESGSTTVSYSKLLNQLKVIILRVNYPLPLI